MSSREKVLERVRRATANGAQDPNASYAALERNYIRTGKLGVEERLALMIERLREYDAEVVECSPGDLAETIAGQLAASGRRTVCGSARVAGLTGSSPASSGRSITGYLPRKSQQPTAW